MDVKEDSIKHGVDEIPLIRGVSCAWVSFKMVLLNRSF
jgi:hypothetical protein